MKVSFVVILSLAFLAVAQAGWVAQTNFKDADCTTPEMYTLFQTDVCANETYASVMYTMDASGSLSETFCSSTNCTGDQCFTLPLVEGACHSVTNTSFSYTYYETFPVKLADINPVEIIVMFKGDTCDPSTGINFVGILSQTCYDICTSDPAIGAYCKLPDFLTNSTVAF